MTIDASLRTAIGEAQGEGVHVEHSLLKEHPELLVELTTTQKFSFSRQDREDIQLAALKNRFESLVNKVPVLARFAESQGLKSIEKIEDGALLMLPHTMFKSYPLSAIESNRFDKMTKWLQTFTSIDLSHIDARRCQNIDEWFDVLDAETDVRLRHSSGTTGKLSFVTGNVYEQRTQAWGFKRFFEGFGDEPDAKVRGVGEYPVIVFGHAKGGMSTARNMDSVRMYLYGGDHEKFIFSNSGRFSADMLSLGSRLQKAQASGELGTLQLSPSLLARREEFLNEQREEPKRLTEFFDRIATEFRGQPVIIQGVVPIVAKGAIEAVNRGLENVFAPESLQQLAGGTKGQVLPPDYPDIVARFTGVPYPRTGYGMTEASSALTRMCPAGHYHLPPNLVPYLLDPKTGDILPREGVQTGRYGIVDVAAQHRWAGILTGDLLTLDWDGACSCGRSGPYIVGEIRRISELEGGDDKITCAGAPAVHENALQYMAEIGGD